MVMNPFLLDALVRERQMEAVRRASATLRYCPTWPSGPLLKTGRGRLLTRIRWRGWASGRTFRHGRAVAQTGPQDAARL
jgi:hypothetical protein